MPHANPEAKRKYHREYQARRKASDPDYAERRRAASRRAIRKRRERIRELVRAAKDAPCVDCGNKYPAEIMDLDHVRGEKVCNLSKVVNAVDGYFTYAQVEEEIAKCEPRCPTCHRLRHYREDFDDQGNHHLRGPRAANG